MEITKDALEAACADGLSIKQLRQHFKCKGSRLYAALSEHGIARIPLRAGPHAGKRFEFKACVVCGCEFQDLHRNRKVCCSKTCVQTKRYRGYVSAWKDGLVSGLCGEGVSSHIRRYFHEKHASLCSKCGWSAVHPLTGKVPLHLNHIDGNYKHCAEGNLELICPNCHSLTPNFGSLNVSGLGRPKKKLK